jgi:hypothetical protein
MRAAIYTSEYRRRTVDAFICGLAEEVGYVCGWQLLQLVDDPTEQHCLPLAGIAFDP